MNGMTLLFSLLLAYSSACNNQLPGVLTCYGQDIKQFPNIIGEGITHIDILNTSLTQLPNMTSFSDLQSIDIQDNELLSCEEVLKFKEEATDLVVTTDCDNAEEALCHVSEDCIQFCIDILSNHYIYRDEDSD